jgi:peptidoglycan/LPS O-acetylase OafA/YrhL
MTISYLPDIDGLRAMAILSQIHFHVFLNSLMIGSLGLIYFYHLRVSNH